MEKTANNYAFIDSQNIHLGIFRIWKICEINWNIKKAPLKDETAKKCFFW